MKLLSLKCCLCLSRSFSCDHLLTRTPPHFALPILTSACNRYHDIFHTKIFSNEKITDRQIIIFVIEHAWILKIMIARSSWLNCATLRDYEAEYWVSIGHFEAVAVGDWWYWVSRGHLCLYILHKMEIWSGVTDALLTDWQLWKLHTTATQLLIKYKSGKLVTQFEMKMLHIILTQSFFLGHPLCKKYTVFCSIIRFKNNIIKCHPAHITRYAFSWELDLTCQGKVPKPASDPSITLLLAWK